jgi:leucyl/phenylalanyl-tRNA--protein transferase
VAVYRLPAEPAFPEPRLAEPDGLLAVGGDLRPERLLEAYASGIFPWYSEGSPILWWSPPERAVFLPGDERFSRRTARALRTRPFEVRRDTCFGAVIQACARAPRGDQDGTWITRAMIRAYQALHQQGFAHSFEAFRDGELVGGLYGISLGAAFFGESMFSREDYASRAAFAGLCRAAWDWGFHFIDGQLPNDNLASLGARVIGRDDYLARLAGALEQPTRRGSWAS